MTESLPSEWISLGVIARPHGVQGELRVHVFNPDSTLLEQVDQAFLRLGDEEPEIVQILSTRRGPKALLMRIADVTTREAADALRGHTLCLPRAVLPPPEEGEYYYADLIGLRATLDGSVIGEVVDVLDYPSVECLKVQQADGVREIPMLPRWIAEIDLDAREVKLQDIDDIPLQDKS